MKSLHTIVLLFSFMSLSACITDIKKETAFNAEVENIEPVIKHYIKVALLLDTSNSMDGLIDQAKAQLWEIVNELSYAKCKNGRPNLEIALYEYGNDNLNSREGYLRKILAFTDDLDDVSKELFSLTTNGGSEYCGMVIQASLNQLDWGNNADDLKMIFIAGNEPFTQGNVDYRDASNIAKEKDVVVNTIFCGDYSHGVSSKWKDGAMLTSGDYMAINQNQKTVHIASPYDDMILNLNIQLNATYVPYGKRGKMKMEMQAAQDSNAAGFSKENAVSRTVSKSSHFYKNSSWDLVDAEAEEDFSYEKLKNEDLPENLKGKSTIEIKAYIEKQKDARNRIQEEISELNKQRRKFIANQKKDHSNGLENAMINALKKQAKKKDYTWN
ncbi:MAG: VWA domain-containing protein [Bacteroidetes bacterium]|nr:MAG: VWA domain-containing protein [Bacteroidota bacterium]